MFDASTQDELLSGSPDYVLDCIDNIDTKVLTLICHSSEHISRTKLSCLTSDTLTGLFVGKLPTCFDIVVVSTLGLCS